LRERGWEVVGWGHGEHDGCAREVNLTDAREVEEAVGHAAPDVVVHLAAISFVAHGDAEEIYRVNLLGTRNLLSALAGLPKRPRHVLLASSANVYGNAGGVLTEDAVPSPQNDYAASKLAMEYMAKLWQTSLPLTIVRPFNYSGVGQSERFLLPKIVSHFRRRATTIELGNLDVSRDFNDVRNVVDIYARLLDVEGSGATYNVCSGQEHTLEEVIEIMRRLSGHSMTVRTNPDFVRVNEVKSLRGDASRLEATIGKLPEFFMEGMLRWMYETPST
jgi:nucleoside-diphosphate-sugar epimerase